MSMTDGTAEATGSEGALDVSSAAERIAALLTPGDSEDGETPEEPDEASQTDEDEGDEPEASDEQSEETEETEEEAPEPRSYTVKVDGEEVTVTEDELLRGYSRTQDYTRKTMELAEARKALEPELQALRQEREQYAELLPKLAQQVQQQWENPALQELRETDPARYLLIRDELQQQASAIQAEQQRIEQAQREESDKERKARLQTEAQELLKAVPELADPKAYQEVLGYALSAGFSADDIRETESHQAFVTLWKAMQYDRLKAKAPQTKAKVEAVKTAKPGAATSQPKTVGDLTRAKQRLAKTGSVDDAAAAIERMFG